MSAWSPKSTAALAVEHSRQENVMRLLRGKGYRDVVLISVEERTDDVIEALFTTPVVTAEGVQRREARRAWICRSSSTVQILDNWDIP
jgi:hypothetical protein